MTPTQDAAALADEIEGAIQLIIRKRNKAGNVITENVMVQHRNLIVAALRTPIQPVEAVECDRISFRRVWIEGIRDALFAFGKLPSGPLGDWSFLFRDQLNDALNRPPSPPSQPALRAALIEARKVLAKHGYCGAGEHGSGDPEINRIDSALAGGTPGTIEDAQKSASGVWASRTAVIAECELAARGPVYGGNYNGTERGNWSRDSAYGRGRHDAADAVGALATAPAPVEGVRAAVVEECAKIEDGVAEGAATPNVRSRVELIVEHIRALANNRGGKS